MLSDIEFFKCSIKSDNFGFIVRFEYLILSLFIEYEEIAIYKQWYNSFLASLQLLNCLLLSIGKG